MTLRLVFLKICGRETSHKPRSGLYTELGLKVSRNMIIIMSPVSSEIDVAMSEPQSKPKNLDLALMASMTP